MYKIQSNDITRYTLFNTQGEIELKKGLKLTAVILLSLQAFALPAWAEEVSTTEESSSQLQQPSSASSELGSSSSSQENTVQTSDSSEESAATSEEPGPEATEASDEPEQDIQEAPTPKIGTLAAAGDGTEANPYLVTTFQELTDVLAASVAAGQTQYIQLQNNIVYNANYIYIKQNTVIDGNGHAFLYSGTNYDTAQLSAGASNINITYKNLSFGNSTYPNNSWYGILYAGGYTGNNLTVEDVTYTMQNGSQPFWGNNGAGNTLTFKGKNNFYSSGRSYGGEFIEGYRNVTFAAGSDTTVYNDAPGATAIFYSTGQTVTVEKNASLSIETSKPYLFYNSATLIVQEQGKFSYKNIYGTNSTSSVATLCVGTLTANFADDSIGHFTTDVNSFTGSNPVINLNSPDYVVFDATSSSRQVLGSMNPIFKRADTDSALYKIDYLTASGQNTYVPKVNTGSSYTVTSGNIGNGYSVAYAKMPSIESMSAIPATGPDISTIDAQIDSTSPANTLSSNVQYKLAIKQLYSGDLASDAAQSSIQNAGTADGVKDSADVTLPGTSPPVGTDTKHSFTKLPAGNYYLYAQANDQRIAGYTFNTLWQEAAADVAPFVLIQFSSGSMSFDSPIPGQFGKQQNLDNYTMRNAGNVPTEASLTSITRNTDSSDKISLVDQFSTNKQELILSLIAEKADSGEQTKLGPLTDANPLNLSTVQLNPFWDTDAQAALYLAGDYSGPMIGPQKFSYRFSFAISAVTTN